MHLLDTHALLWALTDPAKFGDAAHKAIENRSNTLFVSAASAWKVSTKVRLGALPQAMTLVNTWDRNLQRLGGQRLPVSDERAILAGAQDWNHRDPVDRMLAAQVIVESLTLVSKDPTFATLPGVRCLWS